jgi:heme-degrading monooxygenase HmoA
VILEAASLQVVPQRLEEFEHAFQRAQTMRASAKGHVSHQLLKRIDTDNDYLLLVTWRNLHDHLEGFRLSDTYQEWKQALHRFYDSFPTVRQFEPRFGIPLAGPADRT